MDEFRVEVVNIEEETERLKEAANAALKAKDKDGDEEETVSSSSIPCTIQVRDDILGVQTHTAVSSLADRYLPSNLGLHTARGGISGTYCGWLVCCVAERSYTNHNGDIQTI